MNESEQKAKSIADQKKRIRERYKGIDTDALDVIPAIPQEDFIEQIAINMWLFMPVYLLMISGRLHHMNYRKTIMKMW